MGCQTHSIAADRACSSGRQPLLLASSAYCQRCLGSFATFGDGHVALSVSEWLHCSTEWWTVASSAMEADERISRCASVR